MNSRFALEHRYFSNAFELNGASGAGIQIDRAKLTRAHYLLRPLMLRRLKVEVEKLLPRRLETKVMCSLSPMQIFWYKRLLLRDSKLLERVEAQAKSSSSDSATNQDVVGQESGGDWKRLQSLLMQLRKCCNHPFLFPNAEAAVQVAAQKNGETWDGRCNESIVEASGKMRTLDILLRRLKLKGHRVVIFSQFTRMLDIIDDYLNMRGYQFARLDGSTNRVQRMVRSVRARDHLYHKNTNTLELEHRYIFRSSTRKIHPIFVSSCQLVQVVWVSIYRLQIR